jgi:heme a synthase
VWMLARRRGASADQRRSLTALCVLLAAQGVVGGAQYALELPAEIVWIHVLLAALTWLAILWAVAATGRPQAHAARMRRAGEAAAAR